MMHRVRYRRDRVRVIRPRLAAGPNILDAIRDPQVFGPWFRKGDWTAWLAFIAALFALRMTDEQREIYRACTGRDEEPDEIAKEGWLIVGRRGGKSLILAIIAVFLAAFYDYRPYLQAGEKGTVVVIAADRKQARVILRYVAGLLNGVPMLKRLIVRETQEGFELSTGILIEIHTASFRTVRGYTVVAALLDELAFWRSEESSNPDTEIIAALRPTMATIPNAMMLCASSPYARRGALWNAYRRYYGKAGSILVWRAATRTMHPSVPQTLIDQAYEDDPVSAAAEYGAQFRTDVESLVTREVVLECIADGVRERPFVRGIKYAAFVDPSGGSADSFTLAIAHKEGDGAILDCLRERKPPFNPSDVVEEYCQLLRTYRITRVTGDRYAGEWPREQFRKHAIAYEASAKPKSELYAALLPLLNSKRADLLDHERMLNQIVGLERRTARGGRDSIDHAPNGHDDLSNVVAGALTNLVAARYGSYDSTYSWVRGDPRDSEWQAAQLHNHIRWNS